MTDSSSEMPALHRAAVRVWGVEHYSPGSKRLMLANVDDDDLYVDGDVCVSADVEIVEGDHLWLTLERRS